MSVHRIAAFGALTAALAVGTGCFEGFERLDTRVVYDPLTHRYEVEQTLTNLSRGFFACDDVPTCEAAIWRALAGEAPGGFDNGIADRLTQRLSETGAENVRITLTRRGDALDARATYTTVAGARAADDTAVRAEWGGKPGKERFYLVLDHQPDMDMPNIRHTVRRVAGGGGWAESWLLRPGDYDVTIGRPVETPQPIFAAVPGLAERIDGWLDQPWTLGSPPPKIDLPPVQAPVIEVEEAVAAPAPRSGWPAPDPASLARVYVFEPRIVGGYPAEQAATAFAPILPRVQLCWQRASAGNPALQGYLFLDALLRADGSIVSTSVYGDIADASLLACLNTAVEDWAFAPFGAPQAEVSFPLAVRVEAAPAPPGNRRR